MASILGLIPQVMSRWHTTLVAAALLTLMHPLDASGPAAQNVFAEPPTVGGVLVYLKLDFEASDGGFQAEGNAVVTVEAEPVSTARGRSLQVLVYDRPIGCRRTVRPGARVDIMSALSESGSTPQPGGREGNGSCSAYSPIRSAESSEH